MSDVIDMDTRRRGKEATAGEPPPRIAHVVGILDCGCPKCNPDYWAEEGYRLQQRVELLEGAWATANRHRDLLTNVAETAGVLDIDLHNPDCGCRKCEDVRAYYVALGAARKGGAL